MNDNEEYQVANYESELNGSDESEEEVQKQTRTRTTHNYIYQKTFEDQDKAKEWLESENTWSSFRWYDTNAGRKQLLRCKMVPTRGKQCAASAYLLYNADSFQVTLFESIEQHDHEQILEGVEIKGINSATNEAICALLLLNVTIPKAILSQLEQQVANNTEIKVPKIRQLYNFLQRKNSK